MKERYSIYYTDVKREYTGVPSGPDVANVCLKKLKNQILAMSDIRKIPTQQTLLVLNEKEPRTEGMVKEACEPGKDPHQQPMRNADFSPRDSRT